MTLAEAQVRQCRAIDGRKNRTRPSAGSHRTLLRDLGLGLYLSELSPLLYK